MNLRWAIVALIVALRLHHTMGQTDSVVCYSHTSLQDCRPDPDCVFAMENCACNVTRNNVDVVLVIDYPGTEVEWTNMLNLLKMAVFDVLTDHGATGNRLAMFMTRDSGAIGPQLVFNFGQAIGDFQTLSVPWIDPAVQTTNFECTAIASALGYMDANGNPSSRRHISIAIFSESQTGSCTIPTPADAYNILGMYSFGIFQDSGGGNTPVITSLGYNAGPNPFPLLPEVDHYLIETEANMPGRAPAAFSEHWCEPIGGAGTQSPVSSGGGGANTGAPTGSPVAQPTGSPVAQPTGSPVAQPTGSPVGTPTGSPIAQPTGSPIAQPTGSPVAQPTGSPNAQPTGSPIATPTGSPIAQPTGSPVAQPTSSPISLGGGGANTASPSTSPVAQPTGSPIAQPTGSPIATPTGSPVAQPTGSPVATPTGSPVVSPTPGQVFGDPHYLTLDGLRYDFHGLCSYTLIEDIKTNDFEIISTNTACDLLACVDTLRIIFKVPQNSKIHYHDPIHYDMYHNISKILQREIHENDDNNDHVVVKMALGPKIWVNDMILDLDKNTVLDYDGFHIVSEYREENPSEGIEQSGFLITLITDIGLRVQWDGLSFSSVSLHSRYENKVAGLMGTLSYDINDDLLLRNGSIIKINPETDIENGNTLINDDKISLFAKSWMKKQSNDPSDCRADTNLQIEKRICGDDATQKRYKMACDHHLRGLKKYKKCINENNMDPNEWKNYCYHDMCSCRDDKTFFCMKFAGLNFLEGCYRAEINNKKVKSNIISTKGYVHNDL